MFYVNEMNVKIRSILVVLYGIFAIYAAFKLGENIYLGVVQFVEEQAQITLASSSPPLSGQTRPHKLL